MLKYPKYVRRLRKFNKKNNVDKMKPKVYNNARKCLYQIEINDIGIGAIQEHFKDRRWWPPKDIKELVGYIRNAYPKNWFKQRANRKFREMNKVEKEVAKFQFDLDFNKIKN